MICFRAWISFFFMPHLEANVFHLSIDPIFYFSTFFFYSVVIFARVMECRRSVLHSSSCFFYFLRIEGLHHELHLVLESPNRLKTRNSCKKKCNLNFGGVCVCLLVGKKKRKKLFDMSGNFAFMTGSLCLYASYWGQTGPFSPQCRHFWLFLPGSGCRRAPCHLSFVLYKPPISCVSFYLIWLFCLIFQKTKEKGCLPCAFGTKALKGWPGGGCWKTGGGTWRKWLGPAPTGESCPPPTRLNCGFDEKAGEGGGGGGTWFCGCLCWRKRFDSENGLLSPPNKLGKRRPPPVCSWHWLPSNRMSPTAT